MADIENKGSSNLLDIYRNHITKTGQFRLTEPVVLNPRSKKLFIGTYDDLEWDSTKLGTMGEIVIGLWPEVIKEAGEDHPSLVSSTHDSYGLSYRPGINNGINLRFPEIEFPELLRRTSHNVTTTTEFVSDVIVDPTAFKEQEIEVDESIQKEQKLVQTDVTRKNKIVVCPSRQLTIMLADYCHGRLEGNYYQNHQLESLSRDSMIGIRDLHEIKRNWDSILGLPKVMEHLKKHNSH